MLSIESYNRILLKLSGEVLMGEQGYGLDPKVVDRIAHDIKDVANMGKKLCIVIGGGNIFRGIEGATQGIERSTSDHIGMLATVMNGLALQSALENLDIETRVISAIPMQTICEPYIRRRALRHMDKNRVVIFVAGTGNPYFTTDTAATLRASEMECDILLKGTKVDGIYSADPKLDASAVHHPVLSYSKVLVDQLKAMDAAAIALARENKLPVVVFSILKPKNLSEVLRGQGKFTYITEMAAL